MPAEARIQESNPFLEIATHLFLEDLAGKVGVAGLNNYLVSLAKNLAAAMPREEYASWSEFLGALRDGQSTLSTFEEVRPVTERCMTSMRSPFERGWREYAKRVGTFAPVHREVAEYYNHKVRPTAVTSVHIVLHTFREAAAARIRVGEEAVRYEPVEVCLDPHRVRPGDQAGREVIEGGGRILTRPNLRQRLGPDRHVVHEEPNRHVHRRRRPAVVEGRAEDNRRHDDDRLLHARVLHRAARARRHLDHERDRLVLHRGRHVHADRPVRPGGGRRIGLKGQPSR